MTKIKSIGAVSNTVEYQPYDPNLPAAFDGLKGIIRQALPDVRVEHVGSTSIPGVGGRNALDIVIPAASEEHAAIKQKLFAIGFQDSPFQHFLPLLVGSLVLHDKDYGVLLYVVTPDSDVLRGWLAFRDYMRSHPEDASAYDRVKQQAIADGNSNQWSYTQAKTPFLVSMQEKIQKRSQT